MAMDAAGDEPEMVEVTLRSVGPSRPTTLRLPSFLSVADLRRHIAHDRHLPEDRLRLVLRGRNLPCQEDAHVNLRDGDSLIVAVAPKPPANHLRDDVDDDDEEEELKFKIPETTTWWKRKFCIFLRDKLRLPDILLMALFSLGIKAWVIIAIWFLFAPISQTYGVGPLYAQFTDKRYHLDMKCAYSIFNEDFRELPEHLMQSASIETFGQANFEPESELLGLWA